MKASALSDSLKSNSALTTLHLGHNIIGNEGARALSDSLKANSTLTTLELAGNTYYRMEVPPIEDEITKNKGL